MAISSRQPPGGPDQLAMSAGTTLHGRCTFAALSTLLSALALPAPEQSGCIEAGSEIVVEQRRFTEGPPAYVFRVRNRSTASVYVLILGEGARRRLPATAANLPTSMGTPDAWKGHHAVGDDSKDIRYVWIAQEPLARIRPSMSLSGFSVQLPMPDKEGQTGDAGLGAVPFRVFLADGTCHAGTARPDPGT